MTRNTSNLQLELGSEKAKTIVEYREKNGSFASVDDLKRIGGIGSGAIK